MKTIFALLLLSGLALAEPPEDQASAAAKLLDHCHEPRVPKKWRACVADDDCELFESVGDPQAINRKFSTKMANRPRRAGECPPLLAVLGARGEPPAVACERKLCVVRPK
jgi:hypothetical protein